MTKIENEFYGDLQFSTQEILNNELLRCAAQLSQHGILKCSETQSYAYLKVNDDYIHKLFGFISTHSNILLNNIAKPDYFSEVSPIGAHISCVYPEEPNSQVIYEYVKNNLIDKICEFEIKKLYSVSVFEKTFIALTVSCPYLFSLRDKFGLSPKLYYRGLFVPFHITIGIQKSPA